MRIHILQHLFSMIFLIFFTINDIVGVDTQMYYLSSLYQCLTDLRFKNVGFSGFRDLQSIDFFILSQGLCQQQYPLKVEIKVFI